MYKSKHGVGVPLGYCMYCDSKHTLEDEHIIPYFMAGGYIVPKGSCRRCAKITGRFEGILANTLFFGLRKRVNIQRRKKKKNKKSTEPKITMLMNVAGVEIEKEVTEHELPGVFMWPWFPRAGLLAGRRADASLPFSEISVSLSNITRRIPRGPRRAGTVKIHMDPVYMMRLAAKIAHGCLHFSDDFPGFQSLLGDVIKTGNFAQYFVGCPDADSSQITGAPDNTIHALGFAIAKLGGDDVYEYLVVTMHLLTEYGGPRYEVVAARRPQAGASISPYSRTMFIPQFGTSEVAPVNMILRATFGDETGAVGSSDQMTSDLR